MKLIYPEKQGTPTASSENSSYPVSNLVNNIRRKVWRASSGIQTATLRCPINANADALALFNTNAETAICTITLDANEQTLDNAAAVDKGGGLVGIPLTGHEYSEGDVILINGTTNYDDVYALPSQSSGGPNEIIITATYAAETFAGTETACIVAETKTHTLETASRTYKRFWQDYTSQSGAHTATIKLTAGTGETVEAGVFKAGATVSVKTPDYGLKEGRKEYKVEIELNSGGTWGTVLDIVRTFSFSTVLTRSTEFYDLTDVFDVVGTVTPLAWLIAEDIDDYHWSVLARFQSNISGSYDYPSHTPTSISLLEVV